MASVNRITLIGRLTRDPALKYLPSQTPIVEFGMAMEHKYKTANGEERKDVCFLDCSAFGKAAEILNQYVTKGSQLYVSGRVKFDSWEDKQGGKRSKHSVVIEDFQFLGDANGGGGQGGGNGGNQSQGNGGNRQQGYSRPPSGGGTQPSQQYNKTRQEQANRNPQPAFDEQGPGGEEDSIPF